MEFEVFVDVFDVGFVGVFLVFEIVLYVSEDFFFFYFLLGW